MIEHEDTKYCSSIFLRDLCVFAFNLFPDHVSVSKIGPPGLCSGNNNQTH